MPFSSSLHSSVQFSHHFSKPVYLLLQQTAPNMRKRMHCMIHAATHYWVHPITIPLILQGCVLPLLLPSGEFSCHLVNLLLNQTASHYHKEEDTQDDVATLQQQCIHLLCTKHLLICWADSSLSCCLLVSPASNCSTFCSNKLHPILMHAQGWHTQLGWSDSMYLKILPS